MKRLVIVLLFAAGLAHAETPEGTPATVLGSTMFGTHTIEFPGPALTVDTEDCAEGTLAGTLEGTVEDTTESCYFLPDQELAGVVQGLTEEYRESGALQMTEGPGDAYEHVDLIQVWAAPGAGGHMTMLMYEEASEGTLLFVAQSLLPAD